MYGYQAQQVHVPGKVLLRKALLICKLIVVCTFSNVVLSKRATLNRTCTITHVHVHV